MQKPLDELCRAIDDLPNGVPVSAAKMYHQTDWDTYDVGTSDDLKRLVSEYRRLQKEDGEAEG